MNTIKQAALYMIVFFMPAHFLPVERINRNDAGTSYILSMNIYRMGSHKIKFSKQEMNGSIKIVITSSDKKTVERLKNNIYKSVNGKTIRQSDRKVIELFLLKSIKYSVIYLSNGVYITISSENLNIKSIFNSLSVFPPQNKKDTGHMRKK